jgi:RNA polymerase sigma factor (sigma-70 family)
MKYQEDDHYIDRILNGDKAAYAALVAKHKNMAFSIALKIVNNREDAEEVAQDSFLKAYQALPGFGKRARFSTWFYRIVYNTAISKTRKKKFEYVAMDDHIITNYSEDEVNSRVGELEDVDQKALVDKALKRLPEDDQLLITLFYHGEKSVEDITYITGLSESNVKVKLHRIRKKLFEEVSKMMKMQSS